MRAPFSPTLWKKYPNNTTTRLIQVWFPGCHASVGGSDKSHGLSDIALAWMIQQLHNFTKLEYDKQYLIDSRHTFSPHQMNVLWGTEPFTNSFAGIYLASGYKIRTPNKYVTAKDPHGTKTNEYVHKSVKVRIQVDGKKYSHPDISTLHEAAWGSVEQELRWK
jgi:hypothetical protein